MDSLRRAGNFERHHKRWNPIFSTRRMFSEDGSYVKSLQDIFADGDDLARFLEEYEAGTVPSCMTAEVKEYCQEVSPAPNQTEGIGGKYDKAKIWLNDRQYSTQRSRDYEHRITADQLNTLLLCKRFGLRCVPDADRRLVYIPDLDPNDIRALTETASFHQVKALRDAIWKHLALQTSLRVKLPATGFPIFQLEFHLPYSALREPISAPESRSGIGSNGKLRRAWRDASFLGFPSLKTPGRTVPVIHDAHISLVVCGSDHTRWVCYAFVDTKFKNVDDEDDEQDPDETNEDPIASDSDGYTINADHPIWDPREYFLRNVDFRMKQVHREWNHLVRELEKRVEQYIEDPSVSSVCGAAQDLRRDFEGECKWIVKTIELLRHLRHRIRQTIRAWERFESPGGDIGYLADLYSESRITNSLDGIRESFEELKDVEQTLVHLDESCRENTLKILELRMCLESNRLNLESHQINHNAHVLNQETTLLNREGYEVSRKSSEIALANHHTSQLAFSMNLIVASIAIAISLFGTQQDTLVFTRSPKSLLICVFVTIVVVHIFAFTINVARHNSWFEKLSVRVKRVWPSTDKDKLPLHEHEELV